MSRQVRYANEHGKPFLAVAGGHGAITTVGRVRGGVGILLSRLDGVEVAEDGRSARVGGGALNKAVVDGLWAAGKQAVTGVCECTSLMGPALGGGHGFLQGRHGLVADQLLSADVVMADGELRRGVDAASDPDLWWALRGAGHNFGVVTSAELRVFDVERPRWALEVLVFASDAPVEPVYEAMNAVADGGRTPVDFHVWGFVMNMPEVDPRVS